MLYSVSVAVCPQSSPTIMRPKTILHVGSNTSDKLDRRIAPDFSDLPTRLARAPDGDLLHVESQGQLRELMLPSDKSSHARRQHYAICFS